MLLRLIVFEPGVRIAPGIPFEVRVRDGGELGLGIAQEEIEAVLGAGRIEIVRRLAGMNFIAFEIDILVAIAIKQRITADPLA